MKITKYLEFSFVSHCLHSQLMTSHCISFTGISTGCIGKCESSPCLNNGTCLEGYDGFKCNCRWTAFKGPICADGK